MQNAEFVIKTDHKPLKFLLESPMPNRKIQLWALSMAGYNCRIENIQGTTNICADLLSKHPDNVGLEKVRYEQDVSLNVNDNSYQVNVLDSTNFDPKAYASCELIQEDSLQKPESLDLKDFEMYTKQYKDDDQMTLRSQVENGSNPGRNNQRHIIL